jgi:magnesium transporter
MTAPEIKRDDTLNIEELERDGVTWVNVENPGDAETEYLGERFGFHPLDLDDCLSRIQRPKIDVYKNYIFIVLHFPAYRKELRITAASQVAIFVGPDYLVTLHNGDLKPLTKFFRECQIDEESRQENFSQGAAYILYRIVDRLVDYCLPIINKIAESIEETEDNIFADKGMPRAVEEISMIRRDLISFRRIIWPMRAVIGTLESKIRKFSKMDLTIYFDDTVDHIDKIWDGLDEYKEVIEGLHDTHDSMVSNRLNNMLRVLTILATIGAVMTVIASFYGMNVILPGERGPLTWVWLFLGMLVVMVGMLLYFRRKRWL